MALVAVVGSALSSCGTPPARLPTDTAVGDFVLIAQTPIAATLAEVELPPAATVEGIVALRKGVLRRYAASVGTVRVAWMRGMAEAGPQIGSGIEWSQGQVGRTDDGAYQRDRHTRLGARLEQALHVA